MLSTPTITCLANRPRPVVHLNGALDPRGRWARNMLKGLRPTAVLWGLLAHLSICLGLGALALLVALASGFSLERYEEFISAVPTWVWVLATGAMGTAAGWVAGRKAGRFETLHAGLVAAVLMASWLAASGATSSGSLTGGLIGTVWGEFLLVSSPIVGGLLLEVPRVRRERGLRAAGHWRCPQCEFWAVPSDAQCSRCGARRASVSIG